MKNLCTYLILFVCIFFTKDPAAQTLYNTAGTSFVVEGNTQLVIHNTGMRNEGFFTPGQSTLVVTGNAPTVNTFISGNNVVQLYNLTLNKNVNGIILTTGVQVSGTVTFQSGDSIFLNNQVVDLGLTGTINGETFNKRFTGQSGGYITATRVLNNPVAVNPGNMGIEITSTAALGTTDIKRGHVAAKNKSINRTFEIIPTVNAGIDASINFFYFTTELNTIPEAILATYTSSNNGGNWSFATNNPANMTTHSVTTNGINSFSLYTLFATGIDLPVELLFFKAVKAERSNQLQWSTATELNSAFFTIEKSTNGHNFFKLGIVPGAGNSAAVLNYVFNDEHPAAGTNYYRLKQTDLDGTSKYSGTIAVLNSSAVNSLTVYPNPCSNRLYLQMPTNNQANSFSQIVIINSLGLTVMQYKLNSSNGVAAIPVQQLPNGLYYLKAVSANHTNTIPFVKR